MSAPSTTSSTAVITTDVLIVGAGPAGSSLASFLASYGIKGLMISRDATTAVQPRAHVVNPAAFECLRDIGLEQAMRDVGMDKSYYGDYRIATTLFGKDIVKFHSFAHSPDKLGDYAAVSPSVHADVSQSLLEPILIKYATRHGFTSRFNSRFLGYEEDPATGLITSTIEDQVTKQTYSVVSRFLCGADGANSHVARAAKLPFRTVEGGANALNIWYEADLTDVYRRNPGMLHFIAMPHLERPAWCILAGNRVVRPHSEFVMGLMAAPGASFEGVTDEQVMAQLRRVIGCDDTLNINIKGIYRWKINESWAETLSAGNVFCLGDAVDRHSPGNGLGANTAIQDAYNLAWKLSAVLKGKAGRELLDSYSAERQPVAEQTVATANGSIRRSMVLYEKLGVFLPTVEERMARLRLLEEDSEAGREHRRAVREAGEGIQDELSGLGGEFNHRYDISGGAVYLDGVQGAAPVVLEGSNFIRNHIVSTYPGSRLPHAWLEQTDGPSGVKVSTHDLAGHGSWVLFTGIGGKVKWTEAAARAGADLGIDVKVYSIGPGQDYSDIYRAWDDRREVEEDGAILVRPDRFIAWRSKDRSGSIQLTQVLQKVLAL